MSKTITASMPREKTVCGYTVKRMPIGAYLQALQTLEEFPSKVLSGLFPNETPEAILKTFRNMDKQTLYGLLMQSVSLFPKEGIGFFSTLSGISESDLETDENVGLSGLSELMVAWWEVNEIENFTKNARILTEKIKAVRTNIGCKR